MLLYCLPFQDAASSGIPLPEGYCRVLLTIDDIGAQLVPHSLIGQLEHQHTSVMSLAGNERRRYQDDQSLPAQRLLALSPLMEPCSVAAAVDQVSVGSCDVNHVRAGNAVQLVPWHCTSLQTQAHEPGWSSLLSQPMSFCSLVP